MVPNSQLSEAELIERARRLEAEAVAELYRRHVGEIYRYCVFRVADQAAAEDLTEQTFLDMVETLPRYVDGGMSFAAWLLGIARARVASFERQAGERPTEAAPERLAGAAPSPISKASWRADDPKLKAAMAQLSHEHQMVLQLRFIEGRSAEETASYLGKTVEAVKDLQYQALQLLTGVLEE